MIELVFTVCSIVQGAGCHTLAPIPLADGVGMMGCMIATQPEGANYVKSHPNFYIARATCRPVGKYAKI